MSRDLTADEQARELIAALTVGASKNTPKSCLYAEQVHIGRNQPKQTVFSAWEPLEGYLLE